MSFADEYSLEFWSNEYRNEDLVVDEDFIDSDDEDEIDRLTELFVEKSEVRKFPAITKNEEKKREKSGIYIGRDKKTVWTKKSTNRKPRKLENCEKKIGLVKPSAKTALTPLDAWSLFVDEKMLKEMLSHTNTKIRLKTAYFDADCRYQAGQTNIQEFKALLGLLYLVGISRPKHQNLEDLWKDNGTGIDLFRLTMSYFRFTYLISFVSFDDLSKRPAQRKNDIFSPMREIFEQFTKNCQNSYESSDCLRIDGKLEKFLGPCPFRRHVRKSREKYGIMNFRLIDRTTSYVQNMQIYSETSEESSLQENIDVEIFDIIDKLITPISQTSRNVILDDNVTRHDIITNLLKKHKIISLGRANRRDEKIPLDFFGKKVDEDDSTLFGFNDDITLVSQTKNNENHMFYTSVDDTEFISDITNFYDTSNNSNTRINEIFDNYDVSLNTKRWPLAIFFSILNVAAKNAQIIYKINANDRTMKFRQFLGELSRNLIREHLQTRQKNKRLPRDIRLKIGKYFCDPVDTARKRKNVHGRCALCPREKDRKSFYGCANCQRYICLEHAIFYCEECCGTCEED